MRILLPLAVCAVPPAAAAQEARYVNGHEVELRVRRDCAGVFALYQDRAAWMDAFVSAEKLPDDGQGARERVVTTLGGERIERLLAREPGRHLAFTMQATDVDIRAHADLSLHAKGRGCDVRLVLFVDAPYRTADRAAERAASAAATQKKIEGDLRKVKRVAEKS